MPLAAVAALSQGRKIDAIRIVREERRIGLKEAKDLVEQYVQGQPALQRKIAMAQSESNRRFAFWLFLAFALLVGGYYLAAAL
jgi:hypothetical protein